MGRLEAAVFWAMTGPWADRGRYTVEVGGERRSWKGWGKR